MANYKNTTTTDNNNNNNNNNGGCGSLKKGAWTADEDRILAQYVERHGPKTWKSVAINSGLKRCGKSCRLRWLNYLRPNIKRGNISEAEDDLILRLHRLLGNRWSLIARRLPGRTDNEIKNYWNAHLRKKAKTMEKLPATSTMQNYNDDNNNMQGDEDSEETDENIRSETEAVVSIGDDESFDFSSHEGTYGLDWVKSFLELEQDT